jgi:methylglutaconyl-CoA hydratase
MTNTTIDVVDLGSGIVEIAFNRPDKLNAFNHTLQAEFAAALAAAGERSELRAVFVTGRNGTFSAGNDMTELDYLATASTREIHRRLQDDKRWLDDVWRFRQPVIAVVERFAFGAAAELVGRCDLAICSPDAQFGWPEVRAGGVPASTWPVVLGGAKKVKEWFMTGRTFSAWEAERAGLVNLVAEHGRLAELYAGLVANMSALEPTSLAAVKHEVNIALERRGALEIVELGHLHNALSNEADIAKQHWTRVANEGARAAAQRLSERNVPYWEAAQQQPR